MNKEQKRGQLTDRIKEKSVEILGYELSTIELRLLPYIQFTLANSQRLDPITINNPEKEILSKYVEKGFILDGVSSCGRPMISEGVKLKVTKQFYDMINEIIYLGYVDLNAPQHG